ncbi:ATP-binding protein [Microbacterium sp. ZW T2_14]|uniref:ATP-binding protein n=1 Tax=Microbacterium sp. ZW T2_14 TaxID=3378079 RepID=UPI0038530765
MTGGRSPVIRTPDQRIRVFVSSTLRELGDEREAVRSAIERLRLAPVMFELGARPHPPRDLYRSYLAQSDVFVGIYGASYGWVAPEEEVSGLEDEYNLASPEMPKLIYVKETDSRDERLTALIARIQADDTAAYLHFRSAAELEDQVAGDLAMLLAERFDESRASSEPEPEPEAPTLVGRVPVPYTPTIGREADIDAVRTLLARGTDRVVSLVGPGGIGKSRLAIETALACGDMFPDGVYFVLLEGVLEPGLLLPTIAYYLGIRDNGEAALEERIAHALADRRVLIVLDNFEQIVDAAPVLVRLYTVAPTATFLVTSRIVLRIRGERVFEVAPLTTPAGDGPASLDRATRSAAVTLFVDRARAIDADFDVTADNAGDLADICRRLEGLPLAIELAAAKVRILSPGGIAERLERSLPLLTAAVRDLPERHRTMRATIDWSVSLLPDTQRDLLEDLGVFATRFTLEAVEALGAGRSWGDEAIDALTALIDGSLVKQSEVGGRRVFSLLAMVREYALGRLKDRGDAVQVRRAHADYYRALVQRLAPGLGGTGQAEAVVRLGLELPNLRAAVRHLIYTNRLDDAGDFAWSLLIYWWISGFFAEVRVWMLELLEKQHDQPITQHTRAIAWFFALWGEMWQRPSEQVIAGLGECVRLFTESGDEDAAAMALAARATARVQFSHLDTDKAEAELREAVVTLSERGNTWAEAITEVSLGRLAWVRGATDDALAHFDRATSVAEARGDLFTTSVAGNLRARLNFQLGRIEDAEREFVHTLLLSIRLHYEEGVAYGLEGVCAVAAAHSEAWRAAALAVAAGEIRRRIGIFDVEAFTVHTPYLEILRGHDPQSVDAGQTAGAELTVAEAVQLALPEQEWETVADTLRTW